MVIDGFELIEKIRNNPETKHIPFIFLSEKKTDADIFRGWTAGCNLYLIKPINLRELLHFVKKIFEADADPNCL